MSAPLKNQFAAKPESELASAHLHLRCQPREKSAWVRKASAAKKKLAQWVVETLNRAV